MADEISDLLRETLASPLGDVISSVGAGVAAAQRALDEGSLAKTLEIYAEGGDDLLRVLREIGYRPTFYVLPETTGEIQVSLRLSGGGTTQPKPPEPAPVPGIPRPILLPTTLARTLPAPRAYVTPVDATFANKYGYNANASAKISFRIVPVPPPAGLEEVRGVPDLTGRTVAVARDVLTALDLVARFVDEEGNAIEEPTSSAEILGSRPPGGTLARVDSVIELTVPVPPEE